MASAPAVGDSARRFRYVQIDVFTSQRLKGNPLCVFTDARGLSDAEMQDLARETHHSETTFVFPRDASVEVKEGVKVRIFTPDEELPFAGHPTLGTATVLRAIRLAASAKDTAASTLVLDLKVGKVPVVFREDANGLFGEMRQIPPEFGQVHDRSAVAEVLGLDPGDIEADLPIQTISTGLAFAIVPIRRLATLQSLRIDFEKEAAYMRRQAKPALGFFYISRDTGDAKVRLRARGLSAIGEDPATGSASGCTSAWMVKYGIAQPEETVLIRQGVEMKRPSEIFVRASKDGTTISNVRVGGQAVQVMVGELSL